MSPSKLPAPASEQPAMAAAGRPRRRGSRWCCRRVPKLARSMPSPAGVPPKNCAPLIRKTAPLSTRLDADVGRRGADGDVRQAVGDHVADAGDRLAEPGAGQRPCWSIRVNRTAGGMSAGRRGRSASGPAESVESPGRAVDQVGAAGVVVGPRGPDQEVGEAVAVDVAGRGDRGPELVESGVMLVTNVRPSNGKPVVAVDRADLRRLAELDRSPTRWSSARFGGVTGVAVDVDQVQEVARGPGRRPTAREPKTR